MVGDGEGAAGAAYFAAGRAQAFKCLRARHFMDQMAVDINQAGAVTLLIDEMRFPDFIVKRTGHTTTARALFRSRFLRFVFALFADAGGFAGQATKIVELRAADIAFADQLDAFDAR
jgi:hypothetical protein